MATNLTGPLVFVTGCLCAGSGCGGHVEFRKLDITWTLPGTSAGPSPQYRYEHYDPQD